MSNNTKHVPISILVRPYRGRYIAMCKETGIIREANTITEARDAIFSATFTLLKAVDDDPSLEPSLRLGLSFKMKVFFWFSLVQFIFLHMRKRIVDTFFTQGTASDLRGYCHA
jgi:hypothetical protein